MSATRNKTKTARAMREQYLYVAVSANEFVYTGKSALAAEEDAVADGHPPVLIFQIPKWMLKRTTTPVILIGPNPRGTNAA